MGSAATATAEGVSAVTSSVASANSAGGSAAGAVVSSSASTGALLTSSRARSLARSACAARRPALGSFVLGDQRLPVGDRDLIIIRMNFAEGEKAVAVPAVVDEGGLQRRLDARHLGQIDVAAKLFTVCGFEVEFLDAMAAQNNHPGLLRMGRIDEHFVGH